MRETDPQLGDLRAEFNFRQKPLHPMLLNPTPAPGSPAALVATLKGARTLSLSKSRRKLALRLTCNDDCQATATGTLNGIAKGTQAAQGAGSVPAGTQRKLVVHLTQAGSKAIRSHGSARLKLTVVVHSRIGPVRTIHRTVRVTA